MSADLLAAFVIGLLGSSHCILMCGGIVAALQMAMPDISFTRRLLLQLLLSSGRLTTYMLLGAIAGFSGGIATELAGISITWLQLLAGLLLLLMALYIARLWFGLTWLEKGGQKIWRKVQPISKRLLPLDSAAKAYLYGLCWGYLPCGLIYSTLSWSLSSGSAASGAMLMLAFGAGTLPALLIFGSAANRLAAFKNHPAVRYTAAFLLAVYACYTIWLALMRLVF